MTQIETESYSQGFDPNDHTEPWELEPDVMYDELGVGYEAVTEELPGPSRWSSCRTATTPRIQGVSSGWVETAAFR